MVVASGPRTSVRPGQAVEIPLRLTVLSNFNQLPSVSTRYVPDTDVVQISQTRANTSFFELGFSRQLYFYLTFWVPSDTALGPWREFLGVSSAKADPCLPLCTSKRIFESRAADVSKRAVKGTKASAPLRTRANVPAADDGAHPHPPPRARSPFAPARAWPGLCCACLPGRTCSRARCCPAGTKIPRPTRAVESPVCARSLQHARCALRFRHAVPAT